MRPISRVVRTVTFLGCFATAWPLAAHEFWIDVSQGQTGTDDRIVADIRVGQDLSGDALPYLDRTIQAMTHIAPTFTTSVDARIGDRPALAGIDMTRAGLHILTVETKPAYVVFDAMPEFQDYLAYEGLSHIADLHRQRGLGDTEIAEEYLRSARALVQVGPVRAEDTDRPTGLPFEIIATHSPFVEGQANLNFRLEWQGNPAPDVQIAMFYLPHDGSVPDDTRRTVSRTNEDGIVNFPIGGPGQYLLNAVRMEAVRGPGSVVWQSHWASLTFDIANTQ